MYSQADNPKLLKSTSFPSSEKSVAYAGQVPQPLQQETARDIILEDLLSNEPEKEPLDFISSCKGPSTPSES
jgi:hypothetical protein